MQNVHRLGYGGWKWVRQTTDFLIPNTAVKLICRNRNWISNLDPIYKVVKIQTSEISAPAPAQKNWLQLRNTAWKGKRQSKIFDLQLIFFVNRIKLAHWTLG